MDAKRRWSWRNLSIQAKMLVIILPLIVMPMLILAAVGFITSSREAAKISTRYLKQRENDLRTLAENPTIRDYFNNQVYGLREEAEVFRLQLEHSLRRFAERSNSIDLVYTQIRYVDPQGEEVAKVFKSQISSERGRVAEAARHLLDVYPVRPANRRIRRHGWEEHQCGDGGCAEHAGQASRQPCSRGAIVSPASLSCSQ